MVGGRMKLLEHRAKRILDFHAIPIPDGYVIRSPEDLRGFSDPVVLKAQVPVGGRGKAGGIKEVLTMQMLLALALFAIGGLVLLVVYLLCSEIETYHTLENFDFSEEKEREIQ